MFLFCIFPNSLPFFRCGHFSNKSSFKRCFVTKTSAPEKMVRNQEKLKTTKLQRISRPFQWSKASLLLKRMPRKNGKEFRKTQNYKVLENFNTFPMVQSSPNSKLGAKSYAQNTKDSQNILVFFKIGYILGKIKPYENCECNQAL